MCSESPRKPLVSSSVIPGSGFWLNGSRDLYIAKKNLYPLNWTSLPNSGVPRQEAFMYPVSNQFRNTISLSGIWDFRFQGDPSWVSVYVPASYNNQVNDPRARYYTGIVEYKTRFTIPRSWEDQRISLRFDAVTHDAEVFLDGSLVGKHKGGFLPFEIDLTSIVGCGTTHDLLVKVNNRVDFSSMPIGNEAGLAFFGSDNPGVPSVEEGKKAMFKRNLPNFDFFNYAGITREVRLCSMGREHIEDVTIKTDIKGAEGIVDISVQSNGKEEPVVEILDAAGKSVAKGTGKKLCLIIEKAHLWFPKPDEPYLYTAHVSLSNDAYELKFGIRTVNVEGTRFLINGRPFYFKGVGKHEDSAFRGRGSDGCLNVKDVGLLHWLNANSFRTSHYPYAEEMYSLCDKEGIVIIDEVPAVGLNFQDRLNPYTQLGTMPYHKQLLKEMIQRDKNHPCVVMWSLGNEPDTEHFPQDAYAYWHELYLYAHTQDSQNRPVTMVCCQNDYTKDLTTRTMDVACINRYYGWYNLSGFLDLAVKAFEQEMAFWEKTGKPLILTEYGADAIPGYHSVEPEMFTEEFQCAYLEAMNGVLDKQDFVIGEHPWNFADFDTQQGPMRPGGNHKGLFTRDRSPKMAAHQEKKRWASISNWMDD